MHTGRADYGCGNSLIEPNTLESFLWGKGKEMKHLKQQQQQLNGNGTTMMSIRTNGGTNTANNAAADDRV
jgi:hypothetical protein